MEHVAGQVDAASNHDLRRAAELTARRSYGKLVAYLAAESGGDVAAAEDALAEAFATALSEWPAQGRAPTNPEAWLLTVARRKAIDALRRQRTRRLWAELQPVEPSDGDGPELNIPDHRLRLMFVCAHPALDPAIRPALMLQTILGLDAGTIASAFLTSPAAMAQRLVRAKAKIRAARIPFAEPDGEELERRVRSVMEAIYATFATGWRTMDAAAGGLAEEGIRLGRVLLGLRPDDPEALGLLSLMLHAAARRDARRSESGEYVPLPRQDPRRWDASLVDEAERLLIRAGEQRCIGRYQLEAAIQSVHAARRINGRTDWAAIIRLYEQLVVLTGSPVAAINRAVAIAEEAGAEAGWAALSAIELSPGLADYQPYWAARADIARRCGLRDEAQAAYAVAIGLEKDDAVRRFLQLQCASIDSSTEESRPGKNGDRIVRPPS